MARRPLTFKKMERPICIIKINTMKKISTLLAILVSISFISTELNAQPYGKAWGARKKQLFYYYPDQNLYYDVAARQYIYPHNNVWVSASVLPFNFEVRTARRFDVYHYGRDVWNDNRFHTVTYRRPVMYKPVPRVINRKPVVVKKVIIYRR